MYVCVIAQHKFWPWSHRRVISQIMNIKAAGATTATTTTIPGPFHSRI